MLENSSWLEILIVAIIAGLFLDLCLKGRAYGFLGNTLLALIGAVVGGFLWDRFLEGHIVIDFGTATIRFNMVLTAFLGAVVLWLTIKLVGRGRKQ